MTNNNQYYNVIDLTDEESFRTTIATASGNMDVLMEPGESFVVITVDNNNKPAPDSITAKTKKSSVSKKLNPIRSPKKVEKPKKKKLTRKSETGIGNCPICFDKLGTNPIASTKCGHVYCIECLKKCLKRDKRCPTCRVALKGSTGYHPIYLNH